VPVRRVGCVVVERRVWGERASVLSVAVGDEDVGVVRGEALEAIVVVGNGVALVRCAIQGRRFRTGMSGSRAQPSYHAWLPLHVHLLFRPTNYAMIWTMLR